MVSVAFFQVPTVSHGFDISIEVAPSTLNIQSLGKVVTVHTGIAYSSVDGGAVALNGVGIDWWKAGNQGNFAAKFVMTEINDLAENEQLELPGEYELS
jgi:hypothetical protein